MRLRARVTNVPLLTKFVSTCEKSGKQCLVLMHPEFVQFIMQADITDCTQIWARMSVATCFEDYQIQSKANNEIAFELALEHLSRALRSAQPSDTTRMRLTKRGEYPFLELSIVKELASHGPITQPQQQQRTTTIVHNVPIVMVPAKQFSEPTTGQPTVYICMPTLKPLAVLLDRMRPLGEYLEITGNMAGELTFKVESDDASVTTRFQNLAHPQIEGQGPPIPDPGRVATARVDLRKFLRFLYSYQLDPKYVFLCITEGNVLVVSVRLDDLYMTYFIPVVSS